ncbi:hypothetical protein ACFVH7_41810, partial [Kitasatospora indigofera]|uniref:hypothetical protein n=1 Tax=Kitasatospora indigofera TaxID=67307 RepID=UPI0036357990
MSTQVALKGIDPEPRYRADLLRRFGGETEMVAMDRAACGGRGRHPVTRGGGGPGTVTYVAPEESGAARPGPAADSLRGRLT